MERSALIRAPRDVAGRGDKWRSRRFWRARCRSVMLPSSSGSKHYVARVSFCADSCASARFQCPWTPFSAVRDAFQWAGHAALFDRLVLALALVLARTQRQRLREMMGAARAHLCLGLPLLAYRGYVCSFPRGGRALMAALRRVFG